VRRPRWSPQESSLPFTEQDEVIAEALGRVAGSLIENLQNKETMSSMTAQLQNAALAEEKMASIITWLFEVIGSGDSDEHREEIEEMRDTFIRAHYGTRQQVEEMRILEDDHVTYATMLAEQQQFEDEDNTTARNSSSSMMMNQDEISSLQQAASAQQKQYQQEQDWSRAFAEADLDHDGSLSPAEFKQFYSNQQLGKSSLH
jgi:hypothetical protein